MTPRGRIRDESPAPRCPVINHGTQLQCQEIEGHELYHRHLTPARSVVWGMTYGVHR